MGKTAAELMAELANNKKYLAKKNEQDERLSKLEKIYADDEKKLIEDLQKIGFLVGSVWDFVNSKNDYMAAVPTLINHLKIKHHPKILSGLARSLAIGKLSNNDELWRILMELYEKTPSDKEIDIPEDRGVQESIAVALECLTISSRIGDLRALIDRNPSADGIHWLQSKLRNMS